MPPIPIMSTETLASCARTRQAGAAETSTANKTRFIMRQYPNGPLTRSPEIHCRVSPTVGLLQRPLRARATPLDAHAQTKNQVEPSDHWTETRTTPALIMPSARAALIDTSIN